MAGSTLPIMIELAGVPDDLLDQRVVVGQVQRDVQADLVELPDDRLGHGFVVQVAAVRRVQRRLEAIRETRFGEQLLGLVRIVRIRLEVRIVAEHARLGGRGQAGASAAEHELDDLVDIDRVVQRLAHLQIVERRHVEVEHDRDDGSRARARASGPAGRRSGPSTAAARSRSGRPGRCAARRCALTLRRPASRSGAGSWPWCPSSRDSPP